MYEGQSGAPWWIRVDAVTAERYLVAIQSGYINTALPTAVIGPRLAGYGGAVHARACTAGRCKQTTEGTCGTAEQLHRILFWSELHGHVIRISCRPDWCRAVHFKARALLTAT